MSLPKAQGWTQTSESLLEYYETQLLRHLSAPHMVYQLPLRSGEFINTLEIIHPRCRPHTTPVVVIHGFASALATFVNVLQTLSETHANIYAIDLPGFGRSWKPQFPSDNRDAEDLLVESIERWREQMGIDAMILCAHSFGAYIATRYAHRYPTAALILFEPWGFQTKPPTQSQWPLYLVNPLMILRLAGPMGFPLMQTAAHGLFQNTFAGIGEGEEMLRYLYHCNVQCTGDAAFMSLSGPSYLPLRPTTPARNTTVIYGAESWIGVEDFSDLPDVVTEVIPGAGHQIYADQFGPFMAAVNRALDGVAACNDGVDTKRVML